MDIKYSKGFLSKLEDLIAESSYFLRYEKGNFKSGYCILNDKKIIVVNKYYSLEGKINCLIDIIQNIKIDPSLLKEKSLAIYKNIQQYKLEM